MEWKRNPVDENRRVHFTSASDVSIAIKFIQIVRLSWTLFSFTFFLHKQLKIK